MPVIDAVIMAAGLSKRFGQNKLLLPFKGKTVAECFLNSVPFDFFSKINFVYSDEKVRNVCSIYKLNFIKNNKPEIGKGYTIFLGQKESMDSDGTMYFVADQPLIKKETIVNLINKFEQYSDKIIIPKVKGKTYNPVIYPSFCYNDLLTVQKDEGGKSILKKYISDIVYVEFTDKREFVDIDTKEDYRRILKIKEL